VLHSQLCAFIEGFNSKLGCRVWMRAALPAVRLAARGCLGCLGLAQQAPQQPHPPCASPCVCCASTLARWASWRQPGCCWRRGPAVLSWPQTPAGCTGAVGMGLTEMSLPRRTQAAQNQLSYEHNLRGGALCGVPQTLGTLDRPPNLARHQQGGGTPPVQERDAHAA